MNTGSRDRRSFWNIPAGLVLLVFLGLAALLLLFEHRAHLLGTWVLLLPLAICVGMHFFMHRAHGGRHDVNRRGRDEQ
jgi:hypothetical protein